LIFCIDNGNPCLIEGVINDVDPMLDPILEKNFTKKGKKFEVKIGDKSITVDEKFNLFMITKLTNPKFSPELSAKTTIIDFSVTQRGLEDQLLSRVMQYEQKSLEEQRIKLVEDINLNTIKLQTLNNSLLASLSESSGNLLEDVKLIQLLSDTKIGAQEVEEKVKGSYEVEKRINKKRDEYRAVATRGSVIYFVITVLPQINSMYQIALNQFLGWFDYSLWTAEKPQSAAKRVEALKDFMTYHTYVNVDRGLFGGDKILYKFMLTVKILQSELGSLNEDMISLFIRAGSSLSADKEKLPKLGDWLTQDTWLNIVKLHQDLEFFQNPNIKQSIEANANLWSEWFVHDAPEAKEIPKFEEQLAIANSKGNGLGHFYRMLLTRCCRPDRTKQAAQTFIQNVLGERYVAPVTLNFEELIGVSDSSTPIILMLSPGADPTSTLEDIAKRRGLKVHAVSMGEGQEPNADRAMEVGMKTGGWALLQNTHLGLGFMNTVDEKLKAAHEGNASEVADDKKKEESKEQNDDNSAPAVAETSKPKDKADEVVGVHPDFRLWITCEPTPAFPVNLLQIAIKVTNEPPAGMRAGLHRTFHTTVDQERLSRVESKEWPSLVWCLSFMHSAMQERRKFGSIGFSVPYEFNNPDLEASLLFLEKHCANNLATGPDWKTVQYMIAEVQYGGRITDELDRITFNVFTEQWLNVITVAGAHLVKIDNFTYGTPGGVDMIDNVRKFVASFPSRDSPRIFGLHENADITLGINECSYMLDTVSNTRPKDSGNSEGGKSREEVVSDKCVELLQLMAHCGYKDSEVRELVRRRKFHEKEINFYIATKEKDNLPQGGADAVDGFTIPLNVFLYQEIVRLDRTMGIVRKTLKELIEAIKGEIIMTPVLEQALGNIADGKPPSHWYLSAGGEEIAWTTQSLTNWFNGMLAREKQNTTWLRGERPLAYWMTGFYNPQGFLTAARQEVCRRHSNPNISAAEALAKKIDKWALDDIVLKCEVKSEFKSAAMLKEANRVAEGVYIEGLFLEGAQFKDGALCDSDPRVLHTLLPVLYATAITSVENRRLLMASQKSSVNAAAPASKDPKAAAPVKPLYACPVYTKPKRNGLSYITKVNLPSSRDEVYTWVQRGVALLASKE